MILKKILVAFDSSRGSWKALEWAVGLAKTVGAEIVAVTVVKPPEFSPSISEIDEFFEDAEKQFAPEVEKLRDYGQRNGIDIETAFLRGHPAESIVKHAYERKFDLIVMGTRGLGGFKSMIIGSVAQKVSSYSKVPVTIIRE
jgi:nucleotide-binding universal stress UspA family protein